MSKTLQMVFQNALGKNVSISIPEIKEEVTAVEVKTLMELIVSKNIFDSIGGDLVTIMEANVISRDVQEVAVR